MIRFMRTVVVLLLEIVLQHTVTWAGYRVLAVRYAVKSTLSKRRK